MENNGVIWVPREPEEIEEAQEATTVGDPFLDGVMAVVAVEIGGGILFYLCVNSYNHHFGNTAIVLWTLIGVPLFLIGFGSIIGWAVGKVKGGR